MILLRSLARRTMERDENRAEELTDEIVMLFRNFGATRAQSQCDNSQGYLLRLRAAIAFGVLAAVEVFLGGGFWEQPRSAHLRLRYFL
jgi:hypothetical protein